MGHANEGAHSSRLGRGSAHVAWRSVLLGSLPRSSRAGVGRKGGSLAPPEPGRRWSGASGAGFSSRDTCVSG